jgi:predicted nucleic acid-binding protein
MRYLLDTNFLSETAKPRPDPGVLSWTRQQSPFDLLISALSFGEIRKGIELRAPDARRAEIEAWLEITLPRQFQGRILPVDEAIAVEWGRIAAEGRMKGRELPVIDGLRVATAAVHGLTLVTRNERDIARRGVPVLNPWTG